ncbi:unnamed protein product [Rotaria sp. Silwood1]|nr:unnamed protein product [Rotaria sp. Silwood1]CAF1631631.1 unnamed protein product [Rotaria sp. Silwood1]
MLTRFIYSRLHPNPFWTNVLFYENVTDKDFLDHNWQLRNTLNAKTIVNLLKNFPDFYSDFQRAQSKSTMSVKLTPYIASLIDWNNIYNCPIRKQFLPVHSTAEPDHPMLKLDSLHEQQNSPVPGLVHRYPDRVLFLTTSICPVYCRFCTRSYSVGSETEIIKNKAKLIPSKSRFEKIYDYIEQHDEIEDVVISGGDTYLLPWNVLLDLGKRLLNIEHVRRIRCATKGLSVMPMKILNDKEWFDAIVLLNQLARAQSKTFAIHTHINHPKEITYVTKAAADKLYKANVHVRNQTVLLRGINDNFHTMHELIKYLSYINIQPYYVFLHDMVYGGEEFRTTLAAAIDLEKELRGSIAGFNMPQFAVDMPGGGGKRLVSTFEAYDRDTGISIFQSSRIMERKSDRDKLGSNLYFYFDPLRSVSSKHQHKDVSEFINLVQQLLATIQNHTPHEDGN